MPRRPGQESGRFANATTPRQRKAGVGSRPYSNDALDQLTSITQSAPGRAGQVRHLRRQPSWADDLDRSPIQRHAGSRHVSHLRLRQRGRAYPINYAHGTEYAIGRDQKHRVFNLTKDHGTTQSFSYFFDDELKTAPGQTLDYDANFNRTSNGGSVGKDNRLKADANYTYEYDKEGNLLKRTEKALTQGCVTLPAGRALGKLCFGSGLIHGGFHVRSHNPQGGS
jgi:hypothetical protein